MLVSRFRGNAIQKLAAPDEPCLYMGAHIFVLFYVDDIILIYPKTAGDCELYPQISFVV